MSVVDLSKDPKHCGFDLQHVLARGVLLGVPVQDVRVSRLRTETVFRTGWIFKFAEKFAWHVACSIGLHNRRFSLRDGSRVFVGSQHRKWMGR